MGKNRNLKDGDYDFSIITKEHVLQAIQEIDEKGIPPQGNSTTYDLIYNNQTYPPKLVLSWAYRYATGEEARRTGPGSFEGGKDTACFNCLEGLGFIIEPKKLQYKKEIDYSLLKEGFTVTKKMLPVFIDFFGEVPPSEGKKINIEFDGEIYEADFRHIKQKTGRSVFQIRYPAHGTFSEQLKKAHPESWEILEELREEKPDSKQFVKLPDSKKEYLLIEFDENNKYLVFKKNKIANNLEAILNAFIKQAQSNNLQVQSYPDYYKGLKMVVSFGQGVPARIPWISFLYEGQTTSKGIYPVFLYYKKENILVLSYSVSETNEPDVLWQFTEPKETVKQYFAREGYQPPARYGNCYVFKVYDVNNLSETEINNDLNQIIWEYKNQMAQFTPTEKVTDMKEKNKDFSIGQLIADIQQTGLSYNPDLLARFALSLLTKPFVILSGLSGSGKTRLALEFVKWICGNKKQYKVVPVGADWTNRESLLGYPNALNEDSYVCPENNVLDLLHRAEKDPGNPYFLILDEMNLSHVERYFADFLSAMESGEPILLHDGGVKSSPALPEVKPEITLPPNFFIIGTINVDETTYMFSPKVLDRAQVIEFRVSEEEMKEYLAKQAKDKKQAATGEASPEGILMAAHFVTLADRKTDAPAPETLPEQTLTDFFRTLKKVGAEFGYRTASEMLRFYALAKHLHSDWDENDIVDYMIIQKLLPKLHGSRKKIDPILKELWRQCLKDKKEVALDTGEPDTPFKDFCKYPVTAAKVWRMYKNACDNGYTSFAEA